MLRKEEEEIYFKYDLKMRFDKRTIPARKGKERKEWRMEENFHLYLYRSKRDSIPWSRRRVIRRMRGKLE